MKNDQELQEIIKRAQKGDVEALSEIYEHFFDRIYRYILIRVRSKETAEDLAGQTFLKMLERLAGFKWRGAGFRSWLFRIAHNLVIAWFRQKKVTCFELGDFKAVGSAEDSALANQTLSEVLGAFASLNENQRHVILLRLIGGLSCRETAQTLALSEANVRTLQHRALAIVRKELKVTTNA